MRRNMLGEEGERVENDWGSGVTEVEHIEGTRDDNLLLTMCATVTLE